MAAVHSSKKVCAKSFISFLSLRELKVENALSKVVLLKFFVTSFVVLFAVTISSKKEFLILSSSSSPEKSSVVKSSRNDFTPLESPDESFLRI